jgi:hypothetical protein
MVLETLVFTMAGNMVKEKIPLSGIITIAFLLFIAGINAIWLIIDGHGGPLFALLFYSVATFLCLRSRHFGAGLIAGILGFGIHAYELISKGTLELMRIDQVFFYANLILSVPLTFTSYLASRKEIHEQG